ncbi:MAG: hypothetical protein HGB37_00395 [Candidatus Moranbacteria bacterium]|nr:hypothetical protein [Candidatus Moranbacteria bacterium]
MQAAAVAPKAVVEKTTHTEVIVTIKGTRYVIKKPDVAGPMRLEIYREEQANRKGEVKDRHLIINNEYEVYTILYTLLWRGVTPHTLEGMMSEMSIIRKDSDEPAKYIKGEVTVELNYTVIYAGHGGCAEERVLKYFVYTRHDRYASGFCRSKRRDEPEGVKLSAQPREIEYHDVPAIFHSLITSEHLPERAIIP